MQSTCILVLILCWCLLGGRSDEQEFSFRVRANRLQVLLAGSFGSQQGEWEEEEGEGEGDGKWRTISYKGFGYKEGIVVCRSLSNGTMVDYETVNLREDEDEAVFGQVVMNCDSLPLSASDCFFGLEGRNRAVISNIICDSISGHNEGDIRQLPDGRIVQLREVTMGQFVWAHFCARDNYNWHYNVSSLACQSLGYERAREGAGNYKFSRDEKFVYGLTEMDCSGANHFRRCMSVPSMGKQTGCEQGEVIAVSCEGSPSVTTHQITTRPITTYSISSSHSVSSRDTSATRTTNISTAYTSSYLHPSYTTPSYKETVLLSWFRSVLIAGGAVIGVSLLICSMGIAAAIGITILINRSCKSNKPNKREEITPPEEGEDNREHDHYLRMEPYHNGFIKQEDKHYYNTEQLMNNSIGSYQHTYYEIHPVQDSLDSSESGFAEINSL